MHLFFDLDNTVTRSRSKISEELKVLLSQTKHDVIVVSGATTEQIAWQVDGTPCYKLGQNGNHALKPDNKTLWEEKLDAAEKAVIKKHIDQIEITWPVTDTTDLIQDRGCQISYSLLGHNEEISKKEAFDPGGNLVRKELLEKFPFISDAIEVKIGGTTTLDYTAKGRHKGYYVDRLIEEMKWDKGNCVYFGDMLFPGGNDETVIGVIKTQPVTDPADTLMQLQAILID